MKVYKFEIDFKGDLVTREFEVKETPKTYKTNNVYYPTVIKKSEIGILTYGRMYSLSPNPVLYLKEMIEGNEEDIERHEEMIARSKKRIEHLRTLLAETEREARQ